MAGRMHLVLMCDVIITYYYTDNCVYCRQFEASGVEQDLAGVLPGYNITWNKINGYGPKGYNPYFEISCKGGVFEQKARTLDAFKSAILNTCQCNDKPQTSYNCDKNHLKLQNYNNHHRYYCLQHFDYKYLHKYFQDRHRSH